MSPLLTLSVLQSRLTWQIGHASGGAQLWGMRQSFSLEDFRGSFLAQGGNIDNGGEGGTRPVLAVLMNKNQQQVLEAVARLPAALQWVSIRIDFASVASL